MRELVRAVAVMVCVVSHIVVSQTEERPFKRNTLYVELLGVGGLYSLDFEHRFDEHLSGRIGFTSWSMPGFFVVGAGTLDVMGFPVMMHYLSGSGNHHLDLGMGIVVYDVKLDGREFFFQQAISGQGTATVGAGTVGYRYQPRRGGMFFRIGFTPLFTFSHVFPTGGISLGLTF